MKQESVQKKMPKNNRAAHTKTQKAPRLSLYALPEFQKRVASLEGDLESSEDLEHVRMLEKLRDEKTPVLGYIVTEVKGGFSVALFANTRKEADEGKGIRAFLPHSLAFLGGNRTHLIALEAPIQLLVREYDPKSLNIIVSRVEFLQEARRAERDVFMQTLKEGDVVEAVVRRIMPYGAMVDVHGVPSLIHQQEVMWNKSVKPDNYFRVGETLKVKVLEIDQATKKLKLSIKALMDDPWQHVRTHLKVGTLVDGTVVAFTEFGAFVQLESGLEGLVHVSEISWQRSKHPSHYLTIGQKVKARVLDVDPAHKRISLSIKSAGESPLEKFVEAHAVGKKLKGVVTDVRDYGFFVELQDSVTALVPVGELSWLKHVEHPSEFVKVGDEVECVLIDYEKERQRLTCSVKQLTENPWIAWRKIYHKGSLHTLKIVSTTAKGYELEISPEFRAFCSSKDAQSESDESKRLAAGETLDVEVIECDAEHKKIAVSAKLRARRETKAAYEAYLHKQSQVNENRATLGDLLSRH